MGEGRSLHDVRAAEAIVGQVVLPRRDEVGSPPSNMRGSVCICMSMKQPYTHTCMHTYLITFLRTSYVPQPPMDVGDQG